MALIEFLSKHRVLSEIAAYAILVVVGFLNYFFGLHVVVSFFFIIPVFMAAIARGFWRAILPALGAAMFWAAAQYQLFLSTGVSTSYLIGNTLIRLMFYIFLAYIANLLKEALFREAMEGRTDWLTGLANRKGFFEAVEIEIERQERYGHPMAVAYLDVDNLKEINDQWGHSEGDNVIEAVGKTLRRTSRVMDIAARIGGDEFAVAFPETGVAQAEAVAQKIKESLNNIAIESGAVRASIGVVVFTEPPVSVDDMLRGADRAMYKVKAGGKDAIRVEIMEAHKA